MVQDPRVTTLLSRLGGLYRDPNRVDRDASSLLKSSVGIHLTPGISPLVENNGNSSHCLVLQGTIGILFRGTTYQLLVDIYLPSGYPIRPPLSFVRLAKNQYLKENHPHVGSDGTVYLPYTHEWNPRTHSLIEMVVAMSSVFSADPPVFTRAAPASPPPPPAYSSYANTSNDTGATSSERINADRSSFSSPASERHMREQLAAIMAKEAEEANRVAEVVRKAEREEKEQEEFITAQKEWENRKLDQTRIEANKKIRSYLQNLTEETKNTLFADWRDQEHLKQNKVYLEKETKDLTQRKHELKNHIETMDAKTEEIENWLKESESAKEEKPNVDDLCQPVTKLDAQMLNLSAESAALTDTMYFLDKGMYSGQIDCSTQLKMIRKLAKKQFLIRAHLIKINQIAGKN